MTNEITAAVERWRPASRAGSRSCATGAAMHNARSATDLDRAIALAVAAERRARGWSMRQLAEAVGITWQQIDKYEAGTNRIAASRLMLMEKALGIQPGSILKDVSDGL